MGGGVEKNSFTTALISSRHHGLLYLMCTSDLYIGGECKHRYRDDLQVVLALVHMRSEANPSSEITV